ncbi:MAG: hypothetical protein PHV85_10665 [Desulfovibrionaceae bacterium]|nr:hypothetical protein [Desulfovibrionaceae bacterium]MDD4953000.1 hypothetical protein [Desulfovibrionaceae bacterium]
MTRIVFLFICLALVLGFALSGPAGAKDIEDGIGYEDGFDFDNTLRKQTNIKYIKEKAKAAARKGGSGEFGADGGTTNINSAVVGGSVYGDIIIIDEGKGDRTVVH